MIGRLHGKLIEKTPPQVLVDVGGVGYEVDVPMSTFCNLPAEGSEITLLTHFIVREDAQLLYGFATAAERQTFRALIRISGVGPRIALAVLSGMSTQDLADAVEQGNATLLTRVPGIGKKTADRLVLELKGKLAGNAFGRSRIRSPGRHSERPDGARLFRTRGSGERARAPRRSDGERRHPSRPQGACTLNEVMNA